MVQKKYTKKDCRFFDGENNFCKFFGVLIESDTQTCSIDLDWRKRDHFGNKEQSGSHSFVEFIEKRDVELQKRGFQVIKI